MDRTVKVTYNGLNDKRIKIGTTLKEISKEHRRDFDYEILISKVDNDIVELGSTITRNCDIKFYDRSTTLGRCVYAASANFILILAVKNILGESANVLIKHSLDNGVYCEINGISIDEKIISKIEEEMYRIVKMDLLFEKVSVSRTDAIRYFKSKNQIDKVNVLKYISNTYINLYRLDNMYNYFYSKLAYSTSQINDFRLNYVANNGFVLSIPSLLNPECTLDYVHHPKISEAFLKQETIAHRLKIDHASDLNKIVSNAQVSELIQLGESYYDSQLQRAAEDIANKKDVRLVLLAGPSSSGKTTTSKRIMNYLKCRGVGVLQISVDNYFVNKVDTPKDAKGDYDFESLYAVDLDLFNKHLIALMEGKVVEMPSYNFVEGKREYKKNFVQLKENDIMIVEGIHALNDKLTMSIDKKYKYKIYICPLVHLNIDNHNHIHTSDIRKLRRIVRDSKTRGHGALSTLNMWSSIRKGEENNIYPYQDEANFVINSSLLYEIGVLKTYVEPLLFCVDENEEVYPEALRLINFLRNFLPIPSDDVPVDSVLREFIGGSCFKD